jgi:hypothetical protein
MFDTSSEKELISKSGVDVVGSELDVEATFVSLTFLGVVWPSTWFESPIVLLMSPNLSLAD